MYFSVPCCSSLFLFLISLIFFLILTLHYFFCSSIASYICGIHFPFAAYAKIPLRIFLKMYVCMCVHLNFYYELFLSGDCFIPGLLRCFGIEKHLCGIQHVFIWGPQQFRVTQLYVNFSAVDTWTTLTCRTILAFQFLTEHFHFPPISSRGWIKSFLATSLGHCLFF